MKTVPSREILKQAQEINEQNGHENLGYLSESAGFLPLNPPLLQMPESHSPWDEIAPNLPALHKTLELRASWMPCRFYRGRKKHFRINIYYVHPLSWGFLPTPIIISK